MKDKGVRFGLADLWPALIFGLLGAAIAGAGVNFDWFIGFNRHSRGAPEWVWLYLSLLGDTVVAVAATLLFVRRWRELWVLLLIGVLATGVTHTLKPLFAFERPFAVLAEGSFQLLGSKPHTLSFPSGHAMTAFALCGFLILRGGPVWRWFALPAAVLIALSRLAVGAHWPLDIAVGASLGWLCAWAGTRLSERWSWRDRPRSIDGAIALMGASYLWLLVRPSLGMADDRLIEGGLAALSLALLAWPWLRLKLGAGGARS